MKKLFAHRGAVHLLLLLVWIVIGAAIRFTNLAAKSPWSDEFATMVFSLGNSFRTVPLDRAITLDTLLMPLQPHPQSDLGAVFHNLMTESTHPPVYFMLTHLWLQLFPTENGLVSLWAVRSLSAIFGVASIPAIFGLGWLAFRSRLVGQMAAAMMAVSPYGIYQAQEPRHYTLAILLIIASLSCLIIATRNLRQRKPLPIWVGLTWVLINSLGIAVHYFFALTLCAEALVLLRFWILDFRLKFLPQPPQLPQLPQPPQLQKQLPITASPHWWRLYAVAAATLAGGLVWLPFWQSIPDNDVTQWIYQGNSFQNSLETIARFLAWIITMLWLLPIEGVSLPIALISGGLVVIFLCWTIPIFLGGWRIQLGRSLTRLETQVLGGFVLAAIALFLIITYTLGADLSIAARYHFVYFPAVIVVIGAALAVCWDAARLIGETKRQQSLLQFLQARGKKAVVLIWLMGFFGAMTVVFNFGYQKIERADLFVPIIHQKSHSPILIANAHKNSGQTREMMAVAYEFKRLYRASNSMPMFLLARQKGNSNNAITLRNTLAQLPRPLDVWLVNFPRGVAELKTQHNCASVSQRKTRINGYKFKLFHCG